MSEILPSALSRVCLHFTVVVPSEYWYLCVRCVLSVAPRREHSDRHQSTSLVPQASVRAREAWRGSPRGLCKVTLVPMEVGSSLSMQIRTTMGWVRSREVGRLEEGRGGGNIHVLAAPLHNAGRPIDATLMVVGLGALGAIALPLSAPAPRLLPDWERSRAVSVSRIHRLGCTT